MSLSWVYKSKDALKREHVLMMSTCDCDVQWVAWALSSSFIGCGSKGGKAG